jgi:hypothetical protein
VTEIKVKKSADPAGDGFAHSGRVLELRVVNRLKKTSTALSNLRCVSHGLLIVVP